MCVASGLVGQHVNLSITTPYGNIVTCAIGLDSEFGLDLCAWQRDPISSGPGIRCLFSHEGGDDLVIYLTCL